MPVPIPGLPPVPSGLDRNLDIFLRRIREALDAAGTNANEALEMSGSVMQAEAERARIIQAGVTEWAPNTNYTIGDLVYVDTLTGNPDTEAGQETSRSFYIALETHTSAATFVEDIEKWRLITFEGSGAANIQLWTSGTTYAVGDQVRVPMMIGMDTVDHFYVCIVAHTSGAAFEDDRDNWRLLTFEGRSLFGYIPPGGSPPAGLGFDGDSFLATDGRWWVKVDNIWEYQGLVGRGLAPEGTPIHCGTDTPDPMLGEEGDLYVETDDGDVWKKFSTGWSDTFIDILARENGNLIVGDDDSPPAAPVDGMGTPIALVKGDAYLNKDSGRYWKREASGWVPFGDLTGDELIVRHVIFAYKVVVDTDPEPDAPVDGTFNFNTGEQTAPTGWMITRPPMVDGSTVWRSLAEAKSFPDRLWKAKEGDWSKPVPATEALDSNVIYIVQDDRPDKPDPTPISDPIPEDWADDLDGLPKGTTWLSVGTLQLENLGAGGEGLRWIWRPAKMLRDNLPGFGGKGTRIVYNNQRTGPNQIRTNRHWGRWYMSFDDAGTETSITTWAQARQATKIKLSVYDKDRTDHHLTLFAMNPEDIVALWLSEDQWIDFVVSSVTEGDDDQTIEFGVGIIEHRTPVKAAAPPTSGDVVFLMSRARPDGEGITTDSPYQELIFNVDRRPRIALPTDAVGTETDAPDTGEIEIAPVAADPDDLSVDLGAEYIARVGQGITLSPYIRGGRSPYSMAWSPTPDAGGGYAAGYYRSLRSEGNYTVSVTVTDSAGASATASATIRVYDDAPDVAAFVGGPGAVRSGASVLFPSVVVGSGARNGGLRWSWSVSGDGSLSGATHHAAARVNAATVTADGTFNLTLNFTIGTYTTRVVKAVTVLAPVAPAGPTRTLVDSDTPVGDQTPSATGVYHPFFYSADAFNARSQAINVNFYREGGEPAGGMLVEVGLRTRNHEALRVISMTEHDNSDPLIIRWLRTELRTIELAVIHADSLVESRTKFILNLIESSSFKGDWAPGVEYQSHVGPAAPAPSGYATDPRREGDGRIQQGDIVTLPWDIPLSYIAQDLVDRGYIPAMVRFQAREQHLSTMANKPVLTDDGPLQNQWWNPLSALDSAPQLPTDTGPFTFLRNEPVFPITLPRAYGGNGVLTYSLTGTLPAGLAFDLATRKISGTPTAETTGTTMTWNVEDEDGQTDAETFQIIVRLAMVTELDLRLQVEDKTDTTLVVSAYQPLKQPDGYQIELFEPTGMTALQTLTGAGDTSGFVDTFTGLTAATRYRIQAFAFVGTGANRVEGTVDILYAQTSTVLSASGGIGGVLGISQTTVRVTVPVEPGDSVTYQWQYDLGQGAVRRWVTVPETTTNTTDIGGRRGNTTVTVRYRTTVTEPLGTLHAGISAASQTMVMVGEVTIANESLVQIGAEVILVASSVLDNDMNTVLVIRRGRKATTRADHLIGAAVRTVDDSAWHVVGTGYTIQHPEAPELVRNLTLEFSDDGFPTISFDEPIGSAYPVDRYFIGLYVGENTWVDGPEGFDRTNPYTETMWTGERHIYPAGDYYAEVRAISLRENDDPNTGLDDLPGDWSQSPVVSWAGVQAITDENLKDEPDETDFVAPSRKSVARALTGLMSGTTQMVVPTTVTLTVAIGAVAGADCYDWEYRVVDTLSWVVGGTTTTPEQTFTALTPNTSYEVRVMPVDKTPEDTTEDKSPLLGTWITVGTVTTPQAAGTPGLVGSLTLAISEGVPTVTFNKPASFTGMIVRYDVRLFRDGIILPDSSFRVTEIMDAMSVTLPEQTLEGIYQVEVRAVGTGGLLGEWAASNEVEIGGAVAGNRYTRAASLSDLGALVPNSFMIARRSDSYQGILFDENGTSPQTWSIGFAALNLTFNDAGWVHTASEFGAAAPTSVARATFAERTTIYQPTMPVNTEDLNVDVSTNFSNFDMLLVYIHTGATGGLDTSGIVCVPEFLRSTTDILYANDGTGQFYGNISIRYVDADTFQIKFATAGFSATPAIERIDGYSFGVFDLLYYNSSGTNSDSAVSLDTGKDFGSYDMYIFHWARGAPDGGIGGRRQHAIIDGADFRAGSDEVATASGWGAPSYVSTTEFNPNGFGGNTGPYLVAIYGATMVAP